MYVCRGIYTLQCYYMNNHTLYMSDGVRMHVHTLYMNDCVCVQAMEIEVPNIPRIPDSGTHKVYFDPSDLYIDASDFKEVRTESSQPIRIYTCSYPAAVHAQSVLDVGQSVSQLVCHYVHYNIYDCNPFQRACI